MSLRRASFVELTVALTTLAACGPSGPSDQGAINGTDSITDVPNTPVKDQSIGNCWMYATAGWAESLRLKHSGETLNLSESYLGYWHWYEQIAGAAPGQVSLASLTNDEITTGGWFGVAVELMRRYGVIEEGRFIQIEGEAPRSDRQASALDAINRSLRSGALATAEARRDRELVRAELDAAWQLEPNVRAMLDEVFGRDASRTLYDAAVALPASSGLSRPSQIAIGSHLEQNGDVTTVTLADAIGEPASANNPYVRVGPRAWNESNYPSDATAQRALFREAQRALHARLPVVMTWFVDFNAMDWNSGAFKAPPATPGHQGGHMTVLEDYEITNVPGFGALHAGTLVTDPAALEASLSEEATISFVRVKNSWGTELAPPEGAAELLGYHDIYKAYLDGPLDYCVGDAADPCATKFPTPGLMGLVLPPAGFADPGSCRDSCTQGERLTSACGGCVASICDADPYCCQTAWDSQCVKEVGSVCNLTCAAPPPPSGPVNVCHDPCAEGSPQLAACGTCAESVCAADPYCCTNAWDKLCTEAVPSKCNQTCG